MKGFLTWFKKSTKLKRWIFIILVGIILSCYGFANVLVIDEITFQRMINIITTAISNYLMKRLQIL